MSHFAHITNGVVDQIIVIEQEMLNTGAWGDPSEWVQTSYNTEEGKHKLGGTPLRKNFAGLGYTYDKKLDAFVPPKEYDSFVLDEEKGKYVAPVPMPKDGKEYAWDDEKADWAKVNRK